MVRCPKMKMVGGGGLPKRQLSVLSTQRYTADPGRADQMCHNINEVLCMVKLYIPYYEKLPQQSNYYLHNLPYWYQLCLSGDCSS